MTLFLIFTPGYTWNVSNVLGYSECKAHHWLYTIIRNWYFPDRIVSKICLSFLKWKWLTSMYPYQGFCLQHSSLPTKEIVVIDPSFIIIMIIICTLDEFAPSTRYVLRKGARFDALAVFVVFRKSVFCLRFVLKERSADAMPIGKVTKRRRNSISTSGKMCTNERV